MILPPTFSMKSPKATKTSGPEDTGKRRDADEDKCNKKRGNGNEDAARSLVKNESPHGEICMFANETWVANFAGKQLDQRPQWNDNCRCCPCWFLQKYCFSDCPNKERHIPADKIPPRNDNKNTNPSANVGLGQGMSQIGSGSSQASYDLHQIGAALRKNYSSYRTKQKKVPRVFSPKP